MDPKEQKKRQHLETSETQFISTTTPDTPTRLTDDQLTKASSVQHTPPERRVAHSRTVRRTGHCQELSWQVHVSRAVSDGSS